MDESSVSISTPTPKAQKTSGRREQKEYKSWWMGSGTIKSMDSEGDMALARINSQMLWLPAQGQANQSSSVDEAPAFGGGAKGS